MYVLPVFVSQWKRKQTFFRFKFLCFLNSYQFLLLCIPLCLSLLLFIIFHTYVLQPYTDQTGGWPATASLGWWCRCSMVDDTYSTTQYIYLRSKTDEMARDKVHHNKIGPIRGLTVDSLQLTFVPTSKSRDTKTRQNITNPAWSNLDIVP